MSPRTAPAGTPLGDAFHVFDTTLRDGAQREGITYSVADKLAVARLLDELGVGFIEGGWPGALPKDTEFFARAAHRAGPAARRARRLRRDPQGRRRASSDDPQVRALLDAQTPVGLAWSPSPTSGTSSGRCAPTPEENLRDGRRHRRVPASARAGGSSSTASTSSTASGFDPRHRAAVLRRGRSPRAPSVAVLCDTNGGMLPLGIAEVVDGGRGRATGVPARHPLPERHRLRGGQHRRRRRGRASRTSSAPPTATASAPATPTCSPSSATS